MVSGSDNKQSHFKEVEENINNPELSKMEKLRLALLFSIRYENDERVSKVKDLLRRQGLMENQVKIIDCLLEYGGKAKRTSDLF